MELEEELLQAIHKFFSDTGETITHYDNELSYLCALSSLDELLSAVEKVHAMLTASVGNSRILLDLYQVLQLKIFLLLLDSSPFEPPQCFEVLDMIIIVCGPKELILEIMDHLEAQLELPSLHVPFVPSSIDVKPTAPSPSRYSDISLEDFMSTPNVPKIINGLIDHWPALRVWSHPHYFFNTMRHRLVPVELGESYMEPNWKQKIMPMGTFLKEYICNDAPNCIAYMAQYDLLSAIPSLLMDVDDLNVCEMELPGGYENVLRNVWIGMKNCYSPMHFDKYYNMFCQIVGRKHIRLLPPDAFGPADVQGNTLNRAECVISEPRISSKILEVVLGPGECLYIPKGWWHEVRSLSSFNISISHWY